MFFKESISWIKVEGETSFARYFFLLAHFPHPLELLLFTR
jgi:hypothetical protein